MSTSIAVAQKAKMVVTRTIANPQVIETTTKEGIVEFKPTKASDYFLKKLPEEELPKVWRVVDAEVTDLVSKIFPKLLKRFPRANIDNVVAFVRQNLHVNHARIVRTENAWGLAMVHNSFLDNLPYVADFGVFALKPTAHEPMSIYYDLLRWSISLGCSEFRYGSMMGSDIEPFAKRIGYDHKHVMYSKVLK